MQPIESKSGKSVDFNVVLKLSNDINGRNDDDINELNNKDKGYILLDFKDGDSKPSVYYCFRSLYNRLDLTQSSVGKYYSSTRYNTPIPSSISIIENGALSKIANFQEKVNSPRFFKIGHKAFDRINSIIKAIEDVDLPTNGM